MAHYAKVFEGKVTSVIVADESFIENYKSDDDGEWVQTSYNTHGGVHPEGRPLRKNYAGIGYTYDRERDAFIPPKVYASWVLNEETCLWEAPVPMPDDGQVYKWDEEQTAWVLAKAPRVVGEIPVTVNE